MKYTYQCGVGPHELIAQEPLDGIACLEHGTLARRMRRFAVATARQNRDIARYDPQTGTYVSNHREFLDTLKRQAERESNELGMECRLTTVDAADQEGLNELRNMTPEDRAADLEPTFKVERTRAAT